MILEVIYAGRRDEVEMEKMKDGFGERETESERWKGLREENSHRGSRA